MKIKFVKQDCWVGLYWKTESEPAGRWLNDYSYRLFFKRTWYLCLIPCFPIIWTTYRCACGVCNPGKTKLTP